MAKMTISAEMVGDMIQKKDGGNEAKIKSEEIVNYMFRLVEELNHVLTHLTGENISNTGMEDIRNTISKSGIKTDIGGYSFDDSGIWYTDGDGNKTKVVNLNAE